MGLFHHPDHDEPAEPVEVDAALGDHAMGIELQLLEVSAKRERAEAQGDTALVRRLDADAETLQAELGEVGTRLGV